MKNSFDSKLQIYPIFSIRICSRKQDIFGKVQQLKLLNGIKIPTHLYPKPNF